MIDTEIICLLIFLVVCFCLFTAVIFFKNNKTLTQEENIIFCENCKYRHAVYWYWKEGREFDYYECWHPKYKKLIKNVDYSTGEDRSYFNAPKGKDQNRRGDCKDYELQTYWWKFWS